MCPGMRLGELLGQGRAKARGEREDPDALDGKGVEPVAVELAAALGVAEAEPVGGLVAGAGEALLFDEGLEEDGAVAVAREPVGGESSRGERLRTPRNLACGEAQAIRKKLA